MDNALLFAFLGGVGILLLLILFFRVNAFISLLISSICVGLFAGMEFDKIIDNVISGMGNTLGFVATIIGLGAIFGAVLEHSGATERLANFMLQKFGTKRSPTALSISGFLIAIPVFFDVAFIILVPVIYALQKRTGKSLLYFAIPLLASLAVTHAFIPPTPGPIAVADIIKADLGTIIFYGFIVGIPTTLIAGIFFGKYISKKIHVEAPNLQLEENKRLKTSKLPSIGLVLGLIMLPIFLILINTIGNSPHTAKVKKKYPIEFFQNLENEINPNAPKIIDGKSYLKLVGQKIKEEKSFNLKLLSFVGHPIIALIFSTLMALYFLGIRYGATKKELQEVSMKALGPAGVIILITGAGGVFKQMLVETGAGEMLADQFIKYNVAPILAAYVVALLIRLLQGSATVAMITAAGIMAPIIANMNSSWLVNRYLGLSELQTLKSWTVMTGILSLTALGIILILNFMLV